MGFRFVQKSVTLNDLERSNAYSLMITGNQESDQLGTQRSALVSANLLVDIVVIIGMCVSI